ncbi:MAG: OadG family transporter subunit [Oscillospiraceae bacterium]|nr:OadG family transporter subunit [Oscillospiraceae bacterium]
MFDNFDMGMPLGEKLVFALQVSLFGILMVFLLLIILAVLIMIISRVVRLGENLAGKKGKKNAASDEPAPVQQSAAAGTPLLGTQSQGTLELDGVDEPTAAVIMAIVSDESGIPLNRLLFKSIKKKD